MNRVLSALTLFAVMAASVAPAARADERTSDAPVMSADELAFNCALLAAELEAKEPHKSHWYIPHVPGVIKRHPIVTAVATRVLAAPLFWPLMLGHLTLRAASPFAAIARRHWARHKATVLPPQCRAPAESIPTAVIEDAREAAKTVVNNFGEDLQKRILHPLSLMPVL